MWSRGGWAWRAAAPPPGRPLGKRRVPSPMPRSRRRPSPARLPAQAAHRRLTWRQRLVAALASWNRYQVGRVIEGVFLVWLVGAVILYLAEHGSEEEGFRGLLESL